MARFLLIGITLLLLTTQVNANYFTCRTGIIEGWPDLQALRQELNTAANTYHNTPSKQNESAFKGLEKTYKNALGKTNQVMECLVETGLNPNLMQNISDTLYPKFSKRGSFEKKVANFRTWLFTLPSPLLRGIQKVLQTGLLHASFVKADESKPYQPMVMPGNNPRADRALQNYRLAQDQLRVNWRNYWQRQQAAAGGQRSQQRVLRNPMPQQRMPRGGPAPRQAQQDDEEANDAEDDDEEDDE